VLLHPAGLGDVDEDAEHPGAQRRAALEAREAADDAEPGFLDDLLRRGVCGHEAARDPQHERRPAADQLVEGVLVLGAQSLEQLAFGRLVGIGGRRARCGRRLPCHAVHAGNVRRRVGSCNARRRYWTLLRVTNGVNVRIRFRRGAAPPRLHCADVVELVSGYFDGALEPEVAERVSAHLAECDGCTAYYDQIRATVTGLRGLELSGLSDEACAALLHAFRDWHRLT